MADELVEALRLAVRGLDAAAAELEAIGEVGPPVPDDLQWILDEHAAFKHVLSRLREMATPEERVRLFNLYRDAVPRCHGLYELPSYPVLPEVVREVDEVREALRRLELSSAEVRDALADVPTLGLAPAGSGA